SARSAAASSGSRSGSSSCGSTSRRAGGEPPVRRCSSATRNAIFQTYAARWASPRSRAGAASARAYASCTASLADPPLPRPVHAHAARRVRRVDAGDAVDDPTLLDCVAHLLGDVADGQAAGGSKLSLVLKDLHRSPPSFVDGRGSAGSAYFEGFAAPRREEPP